MVAKNAIQVSTWNPYWAENQKTLLTLIEDEKADVVDQVRNWFHPDCLKLPRMQRMRLSGCKGWLIRCNYAHSPSLTHHLFLALALAIWRHLCTALRPLEAKG
jgi:hypothetical protein